MKILFIGNSYTFYNDLPSIVYNLAKDSGKDINVDSVTKGGRFLYENLGEDEYSIKLRSLLTKNEYDILVLQEQSHFALKDYGKFEESIGLLKKLVSAGRTVLYATWGRKAGSELLDEYKITSEEMTERLYLAYSSAAAKHGCEIAPVGLYFRQISTKHPEIELYDKDKSHPSEAGSSLAALVLYKRIFSEPPKVLSALPIDANTVDIILNSLGNLI